MVAETLTPFVLAVCKYAFLALLYFFVFRAIRSVAVDVGGRRRGGSATQVMADPRGGSAQKGKAPKQGKQGKPPNQLVVRTRGRQEGGNVRLAVRTPADRPRGGMPRSSGRSILLPVPCKAVPRRWRVAPGGPGIDERHLPEPPAGAGHHGRARWRPDPHREDDAGAQAMTEGVGDEGRGRRRHRRRAGARTERGLLPGDGAGVHRRRRDGRPPRRERRLVARHGGHVRPRERRRPADARRAGPRGEPRDPRARRRRPRAAGHGDDDHRHLHPGRHRPPRAGRGLPRLPAPGGPVPAGHHRPHAGPRDGEAPADHARGGRTPPAAEHPHPRARRRRGRRGGRVRHPGPARGPAAAVLRRAALHGGRPGHPPGAAGGTHPPGCRRPAGRAGEPGRRDGQHHRGDHGVRRGRGVRGGGLGSDAARPGGDQGAHHRRAGGRGAGRHDRGVPDPGRDRGERAARGRARPADARGCRDRAGVSRRPPATSGPRRHRDRTAPAARSAKRRLWIWIAGIVGVLVLVAVGLRLYLDSQYFVGVEQGQVAVFRGVPDKFVGIKMFGLVKPRGRPGGQGPRLREVGQAAVRRADRVQPAGRRGDRDGDQGGPRGGRGVHRGPRAGGSSSSPT